ncbi:MAG: lycopene cyclase family protein [Deinococcales bacterium]
MATVDFLFAGAGASGLALAYFLPPQARVLLIDSAPKTHNDRTWCFWEASPNPFDHLVHRRWQHLMFHGTHGSSRLDIAPYEYKMIRGIDYYNFMRQELQKRPNVEFVYGQIERLESDQTEARATVGGKSYCAAWGFNSAFRPTLPSGYHNLLQHFKGYLVRTPKPLFDPNAATFMDFRIAQNNETRFVYVLPHDPHTALIEYTLFSAALLPDHEYDRDLQGYIQHFLGLGEYTILETEFGIIPMTDAPFAPLHSPRVVNLGIAGGSAKASTGYAFKRLLHHARSIARSLEQYGTPIRAAPFFDRHAWQDSIMLRVLHEKRQGGAEFFSQLFAKNDATTVLKFLDEATSPLEELKLMASVDIPIFTRAALEVMFYNARRSLMRIAPIMTR